MQGLIAYFKDVVEEMKKVTWPSKDDIVSSTVLVVVFALALSLVVWTFDQVIATLVGLIL